MSGEKTPFHSRIFRIYITYLEKRLSWTSEDINNFLTSISTSRERLQDEGSWFSVDFADRFYEELVKRTGDSNLAYKAGHFIHEVSASPIMYRLIRGMMEPGFVFRLLTRFSGHFTKAARFHIVSVGRSSAQVESIPVGDFSERPYMCENRRGMLEGVPQVFGLPAASIHESECLHRGGQKCSYHLKWRRLSERRYWFRWLALAFTMTLGSFVFGLQMALIVLCGTVLLGSLLWIFRKMQNQREELLEHNSALDTMLHELENRNQQLQIIGEVAQLTHSLTSPDQLSEAIVETVCSRLGYDRCILLTTNVQKNTLGVKAFYGFEEKLKELISQAQFNLDSENTSGFFVKVVTTKAPVFIPDVFSQLQNLSPRSQKFAKTLGSRSFVAVPLFNEDKEVVGVLSVDHISQGKVLSISDQDLLMTLGRHLGIALHNAQLVKQLEEHLSETQKLSTQESRLREAFQRFLPSQVASEVVASSRSGEEKLNLFHVKKRSVAILFLDIANFSELADEMESEDVVDLLNTAFSAWEPLVKRNGGFVDKFLGDGMLAIFDDSQLAVDRACAAAFQMIQALEQVNRELAAKNYASICCGIGLNFGPTILGNIGSEQRLNFTAIGEAVNLAFRLQSHTRILGPNTICASGHALSRLREHFVESKDLGEIELKGYDQPIHAYELLEPVKVPIHYPLASLSKPS